MPDPLERAKELAAQAAFEAYVAKLYELIPALNPRELAQSGHEHIALIQFEGYTLAMKSIYMWTDDDTIVAGLLERAKAGSA